MELTVTILAAVMVATTAFYLLQVYKFDLQMMRRTLTATSATSSGGA